MEVYGFNKVKKLNSKEFRKLVLKEYRGLLVEQEELAKQVQSAGAKPAAEPCAAKRITAEC